MANISSSEKIKDFIDSKNGKLLTIISIVVVGFIIIFELYTILAPRIPSIEQNLPVATETQKKEPENKEGETVKQNTFEIYLIKDPFEPLVKSKSEGSGNGSTSEESQSTLSLADIYTEDSTKYASINIGETNYKVKEGDTFATNYKVVTIGTDSVTLLYGDETINLEIGSSISK
jgi:hypothetical protein